MGVANRAPDLPTYRMAEQEDGVGLSTRCPCTCRADDLWCGGHLGECPFCRSGQGVRRMKVARGRSGSNRGGSRRRAWRRIYRLRISQGLEKCRLCGIGGRDLVFGHIVSCLHGGGQGIDNMTITCLSCEKRVGSRDIVDSDIVSGVGVGSVVSLKQEEQMTGARWSQQLDLVLNAEGRRV